MLRELGGVTNPYKFILTGAVTVTAGIMANLSSNVRWKSRLFIGREHARPYTYSLPEIYVSGTLKVELNGGAWNYADNLGDLQLGWSIVSGSDNYPAMQTASTENNYTSEISPLFSGTYTGNASVVIQRFDDSTGTWVNEWTGSVTKYEGDNDNVINNGTWSKNYGGKLTKIRPVITAITATGCREDCINVYLTRIE